MAANPGSRAEIRGTRTYVDAKRCGLRKCLSSTSRRPGKRLAMQHRIAVSMSNNATAKCPSFAAIARSFARGYPGARPHTGITPTTCVRYVRRWLPRCFVHAVPILLRQCVPAASFVATGMVRRAMHDRGFTTDSHSVSHIDCVKEPASVLAEELSQSVGGCAGTLVSPT